AARKSTVAPPAMTARKTTARKATMVLVVQRLRRAQEAPPEARGVVVAAARTSPVAKMVPRSPAALRTLGTARRLAAAPRATLGAVPLSPRAQRERMQRQLQAPAPQATARRPLRSAPTDRSQAIDPRVE